MRARNLIWGAALFVLPVAGLAQRIPDPSQELQRQEEQLRQLRQRSEAPAEARLQTQVEPTKGQLPEESPCRKIASIEVDSSEIAVDLRVLNGPVGDDPPQGRCLGSLGIGLLIERLQNDLIARGFLTSRVVAKPQDLTTGILVLSVVPGRIGRLKAELESEQDAWPSSSIATKDGAVLNLRDIEQSLENLRRNPGADVDIQIAPGTEEGYSDVQIRYREGSPLLVNIAVDDAGSRSTGQWQANGTVSWHSPLGLADLFYVNWGQDFGGRDPGPRGSGNTVVHYSVPVGYWLFGATSSRNKYRQTVVGAFQSYLFSGESTQSELQASRVIHRGPVSKTLGSLKAFARSSRNFIDDTEVRVQRRQTGGWEAGLQHTHYFARATLDLSLSYRQGTGAFAAQPAPEEAFGEGTSRMRLTHASASWAMPLSAGSIALLYSGQVRVQWDHTRLTPQDRFCIGGRYTVRGFDGVQTLCGERGQTSRNELSWAVPGFPLRLFGAVDLGRVSGPSAPSGAVLAGAAVGLRGEVQQGIVSTQLEVFVGQPVRKPNGFETASTTVGFSLNASF